MPAELYLLATCPGYVSVKQKGGVGLGASSVRQFAWRYQGMKKELLAIHEHVLQTQRVPAHANLFATFIQDKGNGLPGFSGQRLLHVSCPYWRIFSGGVVQHNLSESARATCGACQRKVKE